MFHAPTMCSALTSAAGTMPLQITKAATANRIATHAPRQLESDPIHLLSTRPFMDLCEDVLGILSSDSSRPWLTVQKYPLVAASSCYLCHSHQTYSSFLLPLSPKN